MWGAVTEVKSLMKETGRKEGGMEETKGRGRERGKEKTETAGDKHRRKLLNYALENLCSTDRQCAITFYFSSHTERSLSNTQTHTAALAGSSLSWSLNMNTHTHSH